MGEDHEVKRHCFICVNDLDLCDMVGFRKKKRTDKGEKVNWSEFSLNTSCKRTMTIKVQKYLFQISWDCSK